MLDGLEEDRLGDKKYGSTRRGIAPVLWRQIYEKSNRNRATFCTVNEIKDRLDSIIEFKNVTIKNVYGAEPIKVEAMEQWLAKNTEAL